MSFFDNMKQGWQNSMDNIKHKIHMPKAKKFVETSAAASGICVFAKSTDSSTQNLKSFLQSVFSDSTITIVNVDEQKDIPVDTIELCIKELCKNEKNDGALPQTFIDGKPAGTYSEMIAAQAAGSLSSFFSIQPKAPAETAAN
eukprot:Filipodium_phascolosomae@DN758_c0_g1_i1.p1